MPHCAILFRVRFVRILQEIAIILFGGSAYVAVELLWRGRSHISMFLLGGICFWLIGRLNDRGSNSVAMQALLGTCMVTALEFFTGLIVNKWLGLAVWDYSDMPMNVMGQICLYYCLLWVPLSAAAIFLEDGVRKVLFGVPFPTYRLF